MGSKSQTEDLFFLTFSNFLSYPIETRLEFHGGEVPATATERLRRGAFGVAKEDHNAARSAYRLMRRAGTSWKIHIDSYEYKKVDGSYLTVSYLKPRNILEFFISNKPMLLCGATHASEMERLCAAFWGAYKTFHGGHQVYQTHNTNLHHVIPLALWGDEGKGKRRSNTTVVSLEAVIGCKGKISGGCTQCESSSLDLSQWGPRGDQEHHLAKSMWTNMKGHSYLQHWPLFLIPGTLDKDYKPLTFKMLELISSELEELFTTGVQVGTQTWYVAMVGAKGDLKWHSKVGSFTRGYEHKGRVQDIESCHICKAGFPGIPAEDVASHHPCWETSLWYERPWSLNCPPSISVSYDALSPERLFQHDPFHTLRLGLYRDFVGSVVFLYMLWGFFGTGKIQVKLETAHSSFRLWQAAEKTNASLRSFTPSLFNYKNKRSYPWINAKGSDVTLCIKWLQACTYGFLCCCHDAEQACVLRVVLSTSRMATRFFDLMNSHNLWLNTACGAYLYEVGHSFLVGYSWLAGFAYRKQLCLFSLKPKAHFFRHILLSLLHQIEGNARVILNPLIWGCEQNEDFIGKIASLAIKLKGPSCTKRVLEFWMVKSCILYKRHFGKK